MKCYELKPYQQRTFRDHAEAVRKRQCELVYILTRTLSNKALEREFGVKDKWFNSPLTAAIFEFCFSLSFDQYCRQHPEFHLVIKSGKIYEVLEGGFRL